MYVPHAQTGSRAVMYVVKSALPSPQVLAAAREVVRKLDTRLPLIGPSSMTELVDAQLARPRFYLVLLGLFAVLALVLAAVGLYGVVSLRGDPAHARDRRAHGARRAGRHEVVALMLWQGLRPAVAGMALGLLVGCRRGRVIKGCSTKSSRTTRSTYRRGVGDAAGRRPDRLRDSRATRQRGAACRTRCAANRTRRDALVGLAASPLM